MHGNRELVEQVSAGSEDFVQSHTRGGIKRELTGLGAVGGDEERVLRVSSGRNSGRTDPSAATLKGKGMRTSSSSEPKRDSIVRPILRANNLDHAPPGFKANPEGGSRQRVSLTKSGKLVFENEEECLDGKERNSVAGASRSSVFGHPMFDAGNEFEDTSSSEDDEVGGMEGVFSMFLKRKEDPLDKIKRWKPKKWKPEYLKGMRKDSDEYKAWKMETRKQRMHEPSGAVVDGMLINKSLVK